MYEEELYSFLKDIIELSKPMMMGIVTIVCFNVVFRFAIKICRGDYSINIPEEKKQEDIPEPTEELDEDLEKYFNYKE